MLHFLWGKVVLVLVAIIAALQLVHFILLNKLESKNVINPEKGDPNFEVIAAFYSLVNAIHYKKIIDSTGQYQLIPSLVSGNKWPSMKRFTTFADISLVTQCSLKHLNKLIDLAERWKGPISVAVFSSENQLAETLWNIARLRFCNIALRENVSFQLVSPLAYGEIIDNLEPPMHTSDLCSNHLHHEKFNNYANNISYPNNLLRNFARKGASTEFIFVIDIDMLPNIKLREDFSTFAKKNNLFSKPDLEDKTVYVVPVFETKDNIPVPSTKKDILKLLEKGELRPFYIEICWKCQVHTDYEAWQKEPETPILTPLYEVLWKDPWEPFYISRNSVPFYDERFKQYGFNRISQVCELHVAGYKFSVLNNAFLIHRGLKSTTSFHKSKNVDQEQNRILFRQFKNELKERYPESSRRCY